MCAGVRQEDPAQPKLTRTNPNAIQLNPTKLLCGRTSSPPNTSWYYFRKCNDSGRRVGQAQHLGQGRLAVIPYFRARHSAEKVRVKPTWRRPSGAESEGRGTVGNFRCCHCYSASQSEMQFCSQGCRRRLPLELLLKKRSAKRVRQEDVGVTPRRNRGGGAQ